MIQSIKLASLLVVVPASAGLIYCGLKMPKKDHIKTLSHAELSNESILDGGLAPLPPTPQEDEEKVKLGRDLFRDPSLSNNNTVSCQSCHDLNFFGGDSRPFSIGVGGQIGDAHAPSIFNSVFNFRQFWDGRARNLSDQINGPIHNPKEMGSNWPEIEHKLELNTNYARAFKRIYGDKPRETTIIDAIVAFESTLTTPNSAFDRYLAGDRKAMTEIQLKGFEKFKTFGCVSCHQGANVGGNMFQTLGIMGDYFKDRGGSYRSDLGRYNVTLREQDKHVFRVPSLRNIAMTPPYFHDGQVKSLQDAVRLMGHYQLGRDLGRQDIDEVVAFLTSLTGDRPKSLTLGDVAASSRKDANETAH